MPVPNTFGTATTSIPLSQLDANFNTPVTIGSTSVGLGNTVTTVANLTLTNATISSGNVTVTTGVFGAGSNTAPSITTTGDTNTGIFFPAADTIAFTQGGGESMRINPAGNVGIGTTAAGQKLNIDGGIQLYGGANTRGIYWNMYGVDNDYIDVNGAIDGGIMRFGTSNTERMRITGSGNVGIGLSSPATILDINGVGRFRRAADNNQYTEISTGGGESSINFVNSGTALYQSLIFNSQNSGSPVERMRINGSGNLLVGTTSIQSIAGVSTDHTFVGTTNTSRWVCGFINSSASQPYGIAISYTGSAPNNTGNQSIFFADTGATRFEVRSNGGIANFSGNNVNLSDAREKINVELSGSYLNKVCAIPVKTFNYVDQNRETDDGLTLGVIAQDVQKVAPELVMESDWSAEKDGSKMRLSIYQTDLQYALMKSIQELNAKVEAQAVRIAELESK
jgi:hypothetical protein